MVNIKDSSLNFLNKNIFSYLISLYGIGKFRAKYICKSLNLNYFMKVKFLCDKTLFKISKIISNFNVFESLRKFNKDNIDKLISINCYRGIRHRKNLPVRGQNTKNNARTRKGLKKNVLFKKNINVFKNKKKGFKKK